MRTLTNILLSGIFLGFSFIQVEFQLALKGLHEVGELPGCGIDLPLQLGLFAGLI